MVMPSEGGNDELERMIRKVTGRKKYRERKTVFKVLEIMNLIAFISIPVVYNWRPELMVINPFIAWMFVLSLFSYVQAAEGHVEGFKTQRIGFLIIGSAVLLPALGLWILPYIF